MSGGPEEACDVMIAIYDPLRDRMSTHRGYDVPQLQKKYRSIILLKSRYGEGDVAVGTVFHGKVGIWQELPKPTDIIDYTQYLHFTTQTTGGNTEIAIDNTKESNWLKENAYKYGFILRYESTTEKITGYMYEPWHYRYVGSLATYLYENDLTLEEYKKIYNK